MLNKLIKRTYLIGFFVEKRHHSTQYSSSSLYVLEQDQTAVFQLCTQITQQRLHFLVFNIWFMIQLIFITQLCSYYEECLIKMYCTAQHLMQSRKTALNMKLSVPNTPTKDSQFTISEFLYSHPKTGRTTLYITQFTIPHHTASQLRSVVIAGLSGTKLNSKVLNEVNNTYYKPNFYHSFQPCLAEDIKLCNSEILESVPSPSANNSIPAHTWTSTTT